MKTELLFPNVIPAQWTISTLHILCLQRAYPVMARRPLRTKRMLRVVNLSPSVIIQVLWGGELSAAFIVLEMSNETAFGLLESWVIGRMQFIDGPISSLKAR